MSALPDPADEPTIEVERAGQLVGLGRSKAYTEARRFLDTEGREGLPVIAFGRTLRVPTARLLAMLGVATPSMSGTGCGGVITES
ncbi:MAG: hypothetical protein M3046_06670 [Actinomycetota bacterium]|nr:hypothetical protein [Actinomycetota bacterium]